MMLIESLNWVEDALRGRRESPQPASYLELATDFASRTEDDQVTYKLMSGMRVTARESALPYLERLTALDRPAAVREEAECQTQLLLNDLAKEADPGWL